MVEVFPAPSSAAEAVQEVVRRAVSPASEIGGDARLILPDERRIKTQEASIGGTVRAPFLPVPAEWGTPEERSKRSSRGRLWAALWSLSVLESTPQSFAG